MSQEDTTFDSWQAYFGPDERLLWEGRPEPGLHLSPKLIFFSIFGLPFLGAGLFTFGIGGAFLLVFNPGAVVTGIFLIAFSLPFIAIGGGLVAGPWLAGPVAHRRVRYALTNRRAYIAKNILKRQMEVYAIEPDADIELIQGRTDTVNFSTRHGRDSDGDQTTTKIGFENIRDGGTVYRLLRMIQEDSADV